jgi:hypothetical protein
VKTVLHLVLVLCCSPTLFAQDNTPRYYTPAEILEDIQFLETSLNDIHPTFSQSMADASYAQQWDSVKRNIDKPLTKHDVFKLLQPLVTLDGHTTLRFDGKIQPKLDAPYFPFRVIINDDRLYVKDNLSSDTSIMTGTIIESINGIPSTDVINTLAQYIPHDSTFIFPSKISDVFHTFYRLVYGNFAEFSITLNEEGGRKTVRVPGVSGKAFRTKSRPQFEFDIINPATAYLSVGTFKNTEYFLSYVDSVFTVLQQKEIDYLILDKRSGGGFTTLADSLLSYLTDQPYQPYIRKSVKISETNRDYVKDNKSKGVIENGYLNISYIPENPIPRVNRFKGNTYILMGHGSYSAATYFVSIIKSNNIAALVGKNSAQPLVSNGDLNRVKLPNTQMWCYSSMSTYHFSGSENGNILVTPDYCYIPDIEELLSGRDGCLEYAKRLIQAENNKRR